MKGDKDALEPNQGWRRIMSYYSPKVLAVLSFLTAIINAAAFPGLGLMSAKFQYIMFKAGYDPNYVFDRDHWIVYWILVVIGMSFFSGLERILIGICGENLTYNVRTELVRGILYKQLSWFDREERAPGVLTGVLSEDISLLNGMTTETLVVVVEAFMGLAVGLLLGLIYCWQEALLVLVTSPIMIVGAMAMSRLQWGNNRGKTAGTEL